MTVGCPSPPGRGGVAQVTMVFLDERDEEILEEEEEEGASMPTAKAAVPQQWSAAACPNLGSARLSTRLRLATVDNFQGEEAKVVLLSLARNNRHNRVGFVKTSNRANVMLSRAQHGMYIVGNARTFRECQKHGMWAQARFCCVGSLRAAGSDASF